MEDSRLKSWLILNKQSKLKNIVDEGFIQYIYTSENTLSKSSRTKNGKWQIIFYVLLADGTVHRKTVAFRAANTTSRSIKQPLAAVSFFKALMHKKNSSLLVFCADTVSDYIVVSSKR